jgi:hypothetical protein
MDDAGCSVAALTERAAKAALPIAADAPATWTTSPLPCIELRKRNGRSPGAALGAGDTCLRVIRDMTAEKPHDGLGGAV